MQISLTDRERRLLLDALEELRDHSPIQSAPDARVVNELMQRLRDLAESKDNSPRVSQYHGKSRSGITGARRYRVRKGEL